jgi:[ribosomal protein S5]-alanine N-acetyltransferase
MISIRALSREDAREISKWFQLDSDFPGDFSPFPWNISRDAFISRILDTITGENTGIKFYVVLEDAAMVGLLLSIKPENFNFYEIGYYITPRERGKGYGMEAVRQLIHLLFAAGNVLRIEAGTSCLNLPSQRLLEKLGFRREGVRQKTLYRNGTWEDSYLYALIKA